MVRAILNSLMEIITLVSLRKDSTVAKAVLSLPMEMFTKASLKMIFTTVKENLRSKQLVNPSKEDLRKALKMVKANGMCLKNGLIMGKSKMMNLTELVK